MGFIKAAVGSVGGQLADQWKEFFVCDALNADVLMAKGRKKVSGRSSNTQGEDNIITQGSVISVADGQAVLCVEQGAIVDVVAEPGEFTWDSDAQPSVFTTEDLKEGIMASFEEMGKRFGFGGQPGVDQRIYYVNTKELVGNKYGTPSPIPFRVIDAKIGLDLDITVRCNGEYSYRIIDPLAFYKNVAGNAGSTYKRSELEGQMRTELLSAMQRAFGRLSVQGVRYSEIPLHTEELCDILNEELSEKWTALRGVKMVSFGINSINTSEENERAIADFQRGAAMRDPNMAAAQIAAATADAMRTAAGNEAGAAMGFMGMNMASATSGGGAAQVSQLFQQGAAQNAQQAQIAQMQAAQQAQVQPAAAAGSWVCACGATMSGNFCSSCGRPRP